MGKETVTYRSVGLDTNVFIYYFSKHPVLGSKAKQIFINLTANKFRAVTSIITLAELLSLKAPTSKIDQLHEEFLAIVNLSLAPVDEGIAVEAARIRRQYGFRLPDCFQLATAKQAKIQVFITNDKRLKRFRKLKVLPLA